MNIFTVLVYPPNMTSLADREVIGVQRTDERNAFTILECDLRVRIFAKESDGKDGLDDASKVRPGCVWFHLHALGGKPPRDILVTEKYFDFRLLYFFATHHAGSFLP
jgi:hypothetical protein